MGVGVEVGITVGVGVGGRGVWVAVAVETTVGKNWVGVGSNVALGVAVADGVLVGSRVLPASMVAINGVGSTVLMGDGTRAVGDGGATSSSVAREVKATPPTQ